MMLYFTVLSNTMKNHGRWPNIHSLQLACQVQESPFVYWRDVAVLRKSVEHLEFVSNVRKPSRDKNFVYYKPHHESWFDSPKGQVDESHISRPHSWNPGIVCVSGHLWSPGKHSTCTRVPSPVTCKLPNI